MPVGLVVRPLLDSDGAALRRALEASHTHLSRFIPSPASGSDEPSGYGIFKDDELVGVGAIRPRGDGVASIGYWVHVDHLRCGYATALARRLRDEAFASGFRTVLLRHDRANVASGAIASKLGFTRVRVEPHSIDAPGQTGVTVVWEYVGRAGLEPATQGL